jgi:hypothetical protein
LDDRNLSARNDGSAGVRDPAGNDTGLVLRERRHDQQENQGE